MADLKSLIAELEAAKEGSRELNARVATAVTGIHRVWPGGSPYSAGPDALPYTTSLDAALTLVPECSYIDMTIEPVREDCDRVCLAIIRIDNDTRFSGTSTTPALALTVAALKARDHG